MLKIPRINDFQHAFSFSTQTEQYDIFFKRFLERDLGKMFIAIQWDELLSAFGLKDSLKGPTSFLALKVK